MAKSFLLMADEPTQSDSYKTQKAASGLKSSWAFVFLPNEDVLVTQRDGALRVVRNGKVLKSTVAGVPSVHNAGQGGLLDIMLDQDFANNRKIYFFTIYLQC